MYVQTRAQTCTNAHTYVHVCFKEVKKEKAVPIHTRVKKKENNANRISRDIKASGIFLE